ncbi:MAG: ATP-binding cassette domain-containing protein [Puniceicoccales bacterium]|jgi:ABC-type multidrug transport system ATPase subunit|nr:ATP-binding cassette domain-containing protein [Puniceicoccales bacterium]
MLRCRNLTVRAGGDGPEILSHTDAEFRPRALNAVIGPSGCGKTTLVKAILHLLPATGETYLAGEPLESPDELAGRVGFAQQFTNAYPQLTVEETFRAALDLSVRDSAEKHRRLKSVLEITGLGAHRDKRVSVLSGGQLRRLGLGIELTLDPSCLVCDEVTSGLDPTSERQILELMQDLVAKRGKTFFCIIHNLATMEMFDWITVVKPGAVIFQGELPLLLKYFNIPDPLHLYEIMEERPLEFWRDRWARFLEKNPGYYAKMFAKTPASARPRGSGQTEAGSGEQDNGSGEQESGSGEASAAATGDAPAPTSAPTDVANEAAAADDDGNAVNAAVAGSDASSAASESVPASPSSPASFAETPSFVSQFFTLLCRRFLLFVRDSGYFGLTLAITFGFPLIVVIFAITGLPEVPHADLGHVPTSQDDFLRIVDITKEQARIGALASGLIMFQVILLTLMGANNGGREIAAERPLYEKERLAGLSPTAYVFSKIVFVSVIASFQGAWMALFVKAICQFPGPWSTQLFTMMGVCVSMSIVCLAFSALMQTAEKASLLSIYLVGFQIPLSGVVLALPAALTWVCRPFINAYWGWCGYMKSMVNVEGFSVYDAFTRTNPSMDIQDPTLSFAVLAAQAVVALALILVGCFHRRAL